MDLKLQTIDHDLDVSTGDVEILTGREAVSQNLRIRLQFFLAEWFLDARIGIPYYEKILVKNPGTNVVRSIFRQAITTTPGIAELVSLATDYDGTTRTLSITFTAKTTDDEILEFSEEFIILG